MSRHPTYMGPKIQIQPTDLFKYERAGIWTAEEKHDGHWAEVTIASDGRISKITSRSSTLFSGVHVEGLIGTQTSLTDSVLIAELEAGTEAANKKSAALPHRRLHVFDVVKLLGQTTTGLGYEQRRALLEHAFSSVLAGSQKLLLTRQVLQGFERFFDEVTESGGEGLVLKRLGRQYRPSGSDGKTEEWVRCKRFRFVDYVVMSIGRSEGGSPNFQVGLYDKGKLTRVATIKNIPAGLDFESLVGKVIECKGAEVHDSGALRHGHYERTRNDKEPEECTLEAALVS